jgi:hypothetical protein
MYTNTNRVQSTLHPVIMCKMVKQWSRQANRRSPHFKTTSQSPSTYPCSTSRNPGSNPVELLDRPTLPASDKSQSGDLPHPGLPTGRHGSHRNNGNIRPDHQSLDLQAGALVKHDDRKFHSCLLYSFLLTSISLLSLLSPSSFSSFHLYLSIFTPDPWRTAGDRHY